MSERPGPQRERNVDTVFLGCNGVDAAAGVTNINLPETAMKRRMIAVARRRIAVADGSKISAVPLAPLCAVADLDLLITDSGADPGVVNQVRDLGLDVEVVL